MVCGHGDHAERAFSLTLLFHDVPELFDGQIGYLHYRNPPCRLTKQP